MRAIERHMMAFIQKQKIPQKNDCIKCLEAENEALRDRSWKGVKNYVRNRITTLQNASRASKTEKGRRPGEDGDGADGSSSERNQPQQEDGEGDEGRGEASARLWVSVE